MEFGHISIHWNSYKLTYIPVDLWHFFDVFLFWGLPHSFDLAKVSSTVVMWLPSRRCWSNLTNWWVLLEWTSTQWICIEVVLWDSPEYHDLKAAFFLLDRFPKQFCWKDSQRFVVWSAGIESNESYKSESILCRKQGHATCGGLTCYNVSFGGGMVERMSQASGSDVVNCTSTEKLRWYLTCIYQRLEVLLERLNDHLIILQLTQRFWFWNLVWETTRLAGTTTTTTTRTTATWLKDPTGLLPEAV